MGPCSGVKLLLVISCPVLPRGVFGKIPTIVSSDRYYSECIKRCKPWSFPLLVLHACTVWEFISQMTIIYDAVLSYLTWPWTLVIILLILNFKNIPWMWHVSSIIVHQVYISLILSAGTIPPLAFRLSRFRTQQT